jgi:carbon storage regulator
VLVLSRKRNEKINIGKNIKITVVEILHDRVRLGIEAPAELTIVREEIADSWRKGKEKANGNGVE